VALLRTKAPLTAGCDSQLPINRRADCLA
jgi:hypothetical protein